MKTITTTADLAAFCTEAAKFPYVTVDTEFLRERTYYSKLCLIQLAFMGDGKDDAVLVDPLADGLDLAPLFDLFRDEDVVKVFHAARQDLEIFYVDQGVIPTPLLTRRSQRWCAGLASKQVMKRWCAELPRTAWINRPALQIGRAGRFQMPKKPMLWRM